MKYCSRDCQGKQWSSHSFMQGHSRPPAAAVVILNQSQESALVQGYFIFTYFLWLFASDILTLVKDCTLNGKVAPKLTIVVKNLFNQTSYQLSGCA